jgi:hypothetical protein
VLRNRTGRRLAAVIASIALGAASAAAQPAPPSTPNEPSIKVGVLVFADYTIQEQPKIVDTDGNTVTFNAFQITRAYINVIGTISHAISFRVTPDVVRETGTGSSLSGSYVYRLKFAFAQWSFDGHLPAGSFARFGQQPTPWLEAIDTVYRYRFQGPVLEDREGYLSPADAGAAARYVLPRNYGDVQAGFYNGENYQHPELNNQKALQVRASMRPLPQHPMWNGLRLSAFRDQDAYVRNGERNRTLLGVWFEHPRLHAGFGYLAADDRTSASNRAVRARGWMAFATPISRHGWEGLVRLDHLRPDLDRPDQLKRRAIAGVSYWFPHQGSVATALLFDVEAVHYDDFAPSRSAERRYAVHSMVSF